MDEESSDRIEVDYELTVDDIVAFHEYHIRKSPTVRRQYLLAWIIPPAISTSVIIINTTICVFIKDEFLKKILMISGFATFVFSIIAVIEIVFLIGSF